jgi:hypothetical protein
MKVSLSGSRVPFRNFPCCCASFTPKGTQHFSQLHLHLQAVTFSGVKELMNMKRNLAYKMKEAENFSFGEKDSLPLMTAVNS